MKTVVLQVLSIGGMIFAGVSGALAAKADENETAIRASVDSYVKAFNRGDAGAVAAFWAKDGVYESASGETLIGSDAIGKAFTETLSSGKGAQLTVSIDSIRPINSGAAAAEGSVEVTRPGGQAQRSSFTSIHVEKDGKWLLHTVNETPLSGGSALPSGQLKPLAWMEGTWIDRQGQSTVYYVCDWAADGRFLRRSFAVATGDGIERNGIEFIGWDPAANEIRSWTFDSKGSVTEAEWTVNDSGVWNVKSVGTLSGEDGKGSAVQIIKKLGDNAYSWQSVGRHAGGNLLPNSDPVTVVKVR